MNERRMLTKEQALECLVIEDGQVHNFVPSPVGVLGADWDIDEVKECFDEADSIEIGGELCRAMNHGIAVLKKGKAYFFEADNDKLDKYDKEEI